jgi:hypothetical protein
LPIAHRAEISHVAHLALPVAGLELQISR